MKKQQPKKKPLRLEVDKVRTLQARAGLESVVGGLMCGGGGTHGGATATTANTVTT